MRNDIYEILFWFTSAFPSYLVSDLFVLEKEHCFYSLVWWLTLSKCMEKRMRSSWKYKSHRDLKNLPTKSQYVGKQLQW